VAATVNWEALWNRQEDSIVLPTGDELFESAYIKKYGFEHHDTLGSYPMSFQYKDVNGSEAILTYVDQSLYGDIDLADGGDYLIEQYDDEYHLWIQVDQTKYSDRESALPHMRMDELVAQGRADRTTEAVYSVTVYYTKGFKRSTPNVEAFVEELLAETNAGYINSKIPIRIKLHCLLPSSVPDNMGAKVTLGTFAWSKGSSNNLRRSADTTVLLVDKFSGVGGTCGKNYFDRISDGRTIGVVSKSCALGDYGFGHQIGHGFGLSTDRRVASSSSTNYAYGYIIKKRKYRTIMASDDKGEKRVNYYSNPSVKYNRYATGNRLNNNAKVLRDNRFAAASIGNERMRCN
jgi:hypothetical protein